MPADAHQAPLPESCSPATRTPDPADLALIAGELPPQPARVPPADALKARIAGLIRQYVVDRSPQLAWAVARDSATLALHPALRHSPEECTAFCRLHRHWRLLAAQCPAPAAS
jgi:hypothetical protein